MLRLFFFLNEAVKFSFPHPAPCICVCMHYIFQGSVVRSSMSFLIPSPRNTTLYRRMEIIFNTCQSWWIFWCYGRQCWSSLFSTYPSTKFLICGSSHGPNCLLYLAEEHKPSWNAPALAPYGGVPSLCPSLHALGGEKRWITSNSSATFTILDRRWDLKKACIHTYNVWIHSEGCLLARPRDQEARRSRSICDARLYSLHTPPLAASALDYRKTNRLIF